MSINQGQRRSSNLALRTLHAEQHRHIGRCISVCKYIGRALANSTSKFKSHNIMKQ